VVRGGIGLWGRDMGGSPVLGTCLGYQGGPKMGITYAFGRGLWGEDIKGSPRYHAPLVPLLSQ